MLTKLSLKNYRCIRSAEVALSPFTVLVGPNSSGKSSFLAALKPNQGERYRIEDVWQRDRSMDWHIIQKFSSGPAAEYRRFGDSVPTNRSVPFDYQLLHLDIGQLRLPNLVQAAKQLTSDGGNLSNAFASLTRQQQASVAEELSRLVPSFRDVGVEPLSQGNHRIRFLDRWKESLWYPPGEVSDGTMLVTAYLVVQHQDPPVDLLAIEEPERGLHPYLLNEMVSLWRKMTQGKIGPRPIQIVLATHSAELLDHVQPSEVRFLTRDAQTGEVRVDEAPSDSEDWRQAYRTYQDSLGSMWLSGSLGGVPGV